jgi:hypothetical protein
VVIAHWMKERTGLKVQLAAHGELRASWGICFSHVRSLSSVEWIDGCRRRVGFLFLESASGLRGCLFSSGPRLAFLDCHRLSPSVT